MLDMHATMLSWICAGALASAQVVSPPAAPQAAPLTLTLKDALERAQMNAPQLLAAISDANVAHEDLLQARAVRRPTVTGRSDYLGTQGNGVTPNGRYVTNDGVHVYREWAVVHQDFTAAALKTGYRRAGEGEAIAKAKVEIARGGLAATVTKAYYTLLAGQRKYATAQQALDQARQSMDISERLERGGEVAHSDVVKSQLQYAAQEQAFRESKLTMDTARLDLAVLLFRDFDQNFGVVDDLNLVPAVPAFAEVQTMAERENPDLQGFYQEAQTAREQVESLRRSVDLAAESLRLNGLRYQAGEATILELVDAQTTLTLARNAYDDGQVRYRLAVANLQTLTGTF